VGGGGSGLESVGFVFQSDVTERRDFWGLPTAGKKRFECNKLGDNGGRVPMPFPSNCWKLLIRLILAAIWGAKRRRDGLSSVVVRFAGVMKQPWFHKLKGRAATSDMSAESCPVNSEGILSSTRDV
jgi:hypothetical protein